MRCAACSVSEVILMTKYGTIKAIAVVIDVGAPLIATLTQFPIWVERSAEATVSGLFVLFALLSAVPLVKYYKRILRDPSSPLMWGLIFAFLYAMMTIINEMVVISFVGFIANLIGGGLFFLAKRIKEVPVSK